MQLANMQRKQICKCFEEVLSAFTPASLCGLFLSRQTHEITCILVSEANNLSKKKIPQDMDFLIRLDVETLIK